MNETMSPTNAAQTSANRIGVAILVSYLIGRRDAILRLAGNRSTFWVGFLFVLSAAFAREYDGEDLLAEPWRLLIPHAASVASSLLLFLLLVVASRMYRGGAKSVGRRYLQFLSLYWMTAPLAWLYAIPVERFLSAPDSVRANLWLLGLVAIWRVVLIIRVICVLYGTTPASAGVLVLTFGDALVFVLMQTVDVPLLQVMGGVRLSESEQIIASTAEILIFLSVITAPIWLILTLLVLYRGSQDWQAEIDPPQLSRGVTLGLQTLVVASVAIWIIVLPITQPEQRLRSQVDRLVEQNRLDDAIALLESAGPESFPPYWSPPPRVTRGGIDVSLVIAILKHLQEPESPAWLRDIYWGKFGDAMRNSFSFDEYWYQASTAERLALVEFLEKQPPERLRQLFEAERPYASTYQDDSSQQDQELADRFNALFAEEDPETEHPSADRDPIAGARGSGATEDSATEDVGPASR